MLPNEILSKQKIWRQSNSQDNKNEKEENTFLSLTLSDSLFLIPIAEIGEVSEMLPIRIYPIKVPRHLGVISLRGKVIPVISMQCFGGKDHWTIRDRLVIINTSENESFAIIANNVKKISIAISNTENIITLEDRPVRILMGKQILSEEGVA